MMSDSRYPDTKPVKHQYELAVLNEECGEVVQIVGKILRFGIDSTDPVKHKSNYDHLHDEVGDVEAAIAFGVKRGFLDAGKLAARKKLKLAEHEATAPEIFDPAIHMAGTTIVMPAQPAVENRTGAALFLGAVLSAIIGSYFIGSYLGSSSTQREFRLNAVQAAVSCYEQSSDPTACSGYGKLGKAAEDDLTPSQTVPNEQKSEPAPKTPPTAKKTDDWATRKLP